MSHSDVIQGYNLGVMSERTSENKHADPTSYLELASIDAAAKLFVDTPPDEALLLEFCKLSDASQERVLDFARKHGWIELCEHKKDSWWLDRPWLDWYDCLVCRQGISTQVRTSLDAWQACARHITAALRLAALVRGHGKFRSSDLSDLHWGTQVDAVTVDRETLDAQLQAVVSLWLRPCGLPQNLVPYTVPSQPGVYRIQVESGGSLIGRLGLQLAAALASSDSLPVCSLCGELLTTPRKGTQCSDCRYRKNAEASRQRYWNLKAAKQEPRKRKTKYAPAASV